MVDVAIQKAYTVSYDMPGRNGKHDTGEGDHHIVVAVTIWGEVGREMNVHCCTKKNP